jgi:putative transposase
MMALIKDIAKFSDNTYGARRIKKVLNTLSFPVSRHKTAQLMKEANVWVCYKKKYKATTNSDHNKPIYQNELKQNFALSGWLYLCVVIDLYYEKSWVGVWGQE